MVQENNLMTAKDYESLIKQLEDLTEVACEKGTVDHDPYLHGMANGMIFALSLMQDSEPYYINPPDFYQSELDALDQLNKDGVFLKRETNP